MDPLPDGPITFSVVGVTFQPDYPANIHRVEGAMIFGRVVAFLVREPGNPVDRNAIAVWVQRWDDAERVAWHIGHVPAPIAARMAPEMDIVGTRWEGEVSEVRETTMDRPGVSVTVRRTPGTVT